MPPPRTRQSATAAAKPTAAIHNAIKHEPTGAGKDELSRLQQRYYQPTETAIAPGSAFFAHGSDEQQAVVHLTSIRSSRRGCCD